MPDQSTEQEQAAALRQEKNKAKQEGSPADGLKRRIAGKGAEIVGRGAELGGGMIKKAGSSATKLGAELSSTGLGAVVGVPLAAVGGLAYLGGAVGEKLGTVTKKVGEKTSNSGRKASTRGKLNLVKNLIEDKLPGPFKGLVSGSKSMSPIKLMGMMLAAYSGFMIVISVLTIFSWTILFASISQKVSNFFN